jgi:hypothetical protein
LTPTGSKIGRKIRINSASHKENYMPVILTSCVYFPPILSKYFMNARAYLQTLKLGKLGS